MMMHDDACLMFSETIEKLISIIVYDEVYNDVHEHWNDLSVYSDDSTNE